VPVEAETSVPVFDVLPPLVLAALALAIEADRS
jgi:hypothetical protein